MEALSAGAVVVVGAIAFGINKIKYKNLKTSIYKIIQEGIDDLDFDKLNDGINKLREFDHKYKDLRTGEPIKAIWEKINCRSIRLPKIEKLKEKFGLDMDDVKDIESIKNWAEKIKNNVEEVGQALGVIEEEEVKDNEKVQEAKKKLEKVKSKQLLNNNKARQQLDSFNLTELLNQIHKEYEDVLVNELSNQMDVKAILQRNIKKQLLTN